MTELKHLKTFESYSQKYDNSELLEEGKVGDFIKKVATKAGMKIEDFLLKWKDPKTISWAKNMAKKYIKLQQLSKEAYNKALQVNFDPENNEARDFFVQMAKIKGAKLSGPSSPSKKLLG